MYFRCGIFLLVLVGCIGYCTGKVSLLRDLAEKNVQKSDKRHYYGECYDKRWDCNVLARDGHCYSNPHATLRECPIACAVRCDPCVDHRWDCPSLSDHCYSNPFATINDCPKTCGACS